MDQVINNLLSGAITPELQSLAGWVLLVLLLASSMLLVTYNWAPRWCHGIAKNTVLMAWIAWGGLSAWCRWQFIQHAKEVSGQTTQQVELAHVNDLGYFELAMIGAAGVLLCKWLAWRGLLDPETDSRNSGTTRAKAQPDKR